MTLSEEESTVDRSDTADVQPETRRAGAAARSRVRPRCAALALAGFVFSAAGGLAQETRPAADSPVKWNELTLGVSKIRFYGFLRLDAFYDDSRPSNTHTIGFIRSEDPTAPASIGARNDESSFTMHPRLTRFGFDLDGPTIAPLGDAKVIGKLEIDFYNNGLVGQSESRQAVRMRHAYLKLGWGATALLAGQTADVISPIFPIVNNDLVMWGAGNLGDRRPQLRIEHQPAIGESRLLLQGAVGLTGAQDNADLDGNGYRDGETSGRPTLQARAAFRTPVWQKQNLEVGVWGHQAWEKTDTAFAGQRKFDSNAYGIDVTLPLYQDVVWIKGELWQGENADDVRGGIFQGVNTVLGREIESRGGWAEVGVKVHQRVALYGGYSYDNPDNADLPAVGRSLNKIWYGAVRMNYDPMEIGFEYLNWTTEYVGFQNGDDNRIGAFIAYKF